MSNHGETDFERRQEDWRERNRGYARQSRTNAKKKSVDQKKELRERVDRLENIEDRLVKIFSAISTGRIPTFLIGNTSSSPRVMNDFREELDGLRKLASEMDTNNKRNVAEHRANNQESEREIAIEELREGLDDQGNEDILDANQQVAKRNGAQNRANDHDNQRGVELEDIFDGENDLSESFLSQSATDSLSHRSKFSGKQKAGQTLVSTHRSVTLRWLSMVKNEMNLVNQLDADRDGLNPADQNGMDQYILQLENVQKAQISFISEIRDSLHNYISAAEDPRRVVDDDDDSFDDLRFKTEATEIERGLKAL